MQLSAGRSLQVRASAGKEKCRVLAACPSHAIAAKSRAAISASAHRQSAAQAAPQQLQRLRSAVLVRSTPVDAAPALQPPGQHLKQVSWLQLQRRPTAKQPQMAAMAFLAAYASYQFKVTVGRSESSRPAHGCFSTLGPLQTPAGSSPRQPASSLSGRSPCHHLTPASFPVHATTVECGVQVWRLVCARRRAHAGSGRHHLQLPSVPALRGAVSHGQGAQCGSDRGPGLRFWG